VSDKEKLTIVVFSDNLDKALAAFMLATTGATMGMEVEMFFTFWGLNIIKKNNTKIKSRGIKRKLFNFINRGGTNHIKPSKFNMLGIGAWMMKKLMKEINMPSLDEMIIMSHQMGVKLIPCSTTCALMGLPEDAFRSEVSDVAGAAYFLNEARESPVTLFI